MDRMMTGGNETAKDPVRVVQDVKALSFADVWRLFIDNLSRYKELLDDITRKINRALELEGEERNKLAEEIAVAQLELEKIGSSNVEMMKEGALFLVKDYFIWTMKYLMFFAGVVLVVAGIQGIQGIVSRVWPAVAIFPPWLTTFVAMMLLSLWFWRSLQILGRRMYPFVVSFFPGSLQYIYYLLFVPEEISLKGFAALFWSALAIIAISVGITVGASAWNIALIVALVLVVAAALSGIFFHDVPKLLGTAITLVVVTRAMNSILESSLGISITELSLLQSAVMLGALLLFVMWFDLMVHLIVFVSFGISWKAYKITNLIPTVGLEVPDKTIRGVKKEVREEVLKETTEGIKDVLKKMKTKKFDKLYRDVNGLSTKIRDKSTGKTLAIVRTNDKRFAEIQKADGILRAVRTKSDDKSQKVLNVFSRENEHTVMDKEGNVVGHVSGPFQKLGSLLAEQLQDTFKKDPGIESVKFLDSAMIEDGKVRNAKKSNMAIMQNALNASNEDYKGPGESQPVESQTVELSDMADNPQGTVVLPDSKNNGLLWKTPDKREELGFRIGKNPDMIIQGYGNSVGIHADIPKKESKDRIDFLNAVKGGAKAKIKVGDKEWEKSLGELTAGEIQKIKADKGSIKLGDWDVGVKNYKTFLGMNKNEIRFKKGKSKVAVWDKDVKKLVDTTRNMEDIDASKVLMRVTKESQDLARRIRNSVRKGQGIFQVDGNKDLHIFEQNGRYVAATLGASGREKLFDAGSIHALMSRLKKNKIDMGDSIFVEPAPKDANYLVKDLRKEMSGLNAQGYPTGFEKIAEFAKSDKTAEEKFNKLLKETLVKYAGEPDKLDKKIKKLFDASEKVSVYTAEDGRVISIANDKGKEVRVLRGKNDSRLVVTGSKKGVKATGLFKLKSGDVKVSGSLEEVMSEAKKRAESPEVQKELTPIIDDFEGFSKKTLTKKAIRRKKPIEIGVNKKVGNLQSFNERQDEIKKNLDEGRKILFEGTDASNRPVKLAVQWGDGDNYILFEGETPVKLLKRPDAEKFLKGSANNWQVRRGSEANPAMLNEFRKVAGETKEMGYMEVLKKDGNLKGHLAAKGKKLWWKPRDGVEWQKIGASEARELAVGKLGEFAAAPDKFEEAPEYKEDTGQAAPTPQVTPFPTKTPEFREAPEYKEDKTPVIKTDAPIPQDTPAPRVEHTPTPERVEFTPEETRRAALAEHFAKEPLKKEIIDYLQEHPDTDYKIEEIRGVPFVLDRDGRIVTSNNYQKVRDELPSTNARKGAGAAVLKQQVEGAGKIITSHKSLPMEDLPVISEEVEENARREVMRREIAKQPPRKNVITAPDRTGEFGLNAPEEKPTAKPPEPDEENPSINLQEELKDNIGSAEKQFEKLEPVDRTHEISRIDNSKSALKDMMKESDRVKKIENNSASVYEMTDKEGNKTYALDNGSQVSLFRKSRDNKIAFLKTVDYIHEKTEGIRKLVDRNKFEIGGKEFVIRGFVVGERKPAGEEPERVYRLYSKRPDGTERMVLGDELDEVYDKLKKRTGGN